MVVSANRKRRELEFQVGDKRSPGYPLGPRRVIKCWLGGTTSLRKKLPRWTVYSLNISFQTLTLWTRFVLRRMELIGLEDISLMQEGRKEANHTWHHNRGRVEWSLQEENVRGG
ncbi:hypothetical protein V2J09_008857 [Rumex salicifolius]